MLSGEAKPLRNTPTASGAAPKPVSIVGTWKKPNTGTLFTFRADGRIDAPSSKESDYKSGTWQIASNRVRLAFGGGQVFFVTIKDENSLPGGGGWDLVRQAGR